MQRCVLQQYSLESCTQNAIATFRFQAAHNMTGHATILCTSKSSVQTQNLCDHWTLGVHSNTRTRIGQEL